MSKLTLKIYGERELVKKSEAESLLVTFAQQVDAAPSEASIVIDLSCKAWPIGSLQVLEGFFQDIAPRVVELKIDDIMASLMTDDGLESLGFFNLFADAPRLSVIYLDDNALGIRGCEVLRPLFRNENVKELYLCNCGLSAEVGDLMVEVLTPCAPRLIALDLSRNQMDPEGAAFAGQLLEQTRVLEKFVCRGTRALKAGTAHLLRGLIASPTTMEHLKILNLDDCDCGTGDEDEHPVHILVEVIQRSPNLEELILSDNNLESEGIKIVLDALKASRTPLKVCNLGGNEAGEEGAEALADYLSNAPSLEVLDLPDNEFEDDGIAILAEALPQCGSLITINLANNQIEASGTEALLENKVETLKTLKLTDNMDIPAGLAAQLQEMYENVEVDEDLEGGDEEEEDEEDIDELAHAFADSQIG